MVCEGPERIRAAMRRSERMRFYFRIGSKRESISHATLQIYTCVISMEIIPDVLREVGTHARCAGGPELQFRNPRIFDMYAI